MCLFAASHSGIGTDVIYFGIKVFLLIWIVFVPIVITNRLERIIKKLEKLEKMD